MSAKWACFPVFVAVALIWTTDERASAQSPAPNQDQILTLPPHLGSTCDDDGVPEAWGSYGQKTRRPDDPPDLTLWNFFSAGWDDEYTRRSTEDRAPDFALLHVQTNFMEREFRVDSYYQTHVNSKKTVDIYYMDYLLAYSWNRRFQINVEGFQQWNDGRNDNPNVGGPAGGFLTRFQLISTPDSSYALNLRYTSSNPELGNHQTSLIYGIAGFEDLTGYGLYRVGLYGSCQFETLDGPGEAGAQHNDAQYVLTIAKTLTRPDTPLIGNFTVYVESFAQTSLDGDNGGHTVAGIMPGVRFNLGKLPGNNIGIDSWILFGVDIPVCGPTPWDATYRLTYIKNF